MAGTACLLRVRVGTGVLGSRVGTIAVAEEVLLASAEAGSVG